MQNFVQSILFYYTILCQSISFVRVSRVFQANRISRTLTLTQFISTEAMTDQFLFYFFHFKHLISHEAKRCGEQIFICCSKHSFLSFNQSWFFFILIQQCGYSHVNQQHKPMFGWRQGNKQDKTANGTWQWNEDNFSFCPGVCFGG